MTFCYYFFQDYSANIGNTKGRLVLFLFRSAQICRRAPKPILILSIPYLIFYRIIVEWILGIELPWNTSVGSGLKLYHGQGLVVNDHSIIGSNCTLRHNTTIGHKELSNGTFSASPIIGDNVDIGSNVVIIGPVTIGDNVIIGAGSVVVKSLESNAVYAGNPAKLIKKISVDTPHAF
ncbi:serine acetyltransferase [uncultured Sulfuricurvum sp.]|uniref:serine acetyltransferase n=1 Tax=uncultured Sulfuricurvum sp. TaxID=430693 RepID=UPI00263920D4|nr:serine acetyltransferase [uncultured Sulfuricurvum sp.]